MFIVGNIFTQVTISDVFIMYNIYLCAASISFVTIWLSASHHGTKIVREGDEFKSLDFGIYQMATTIDRYEANTNLFAATVFYGEHTLHHLLPTLDHSVLHNFRDILEDTCIEFEKDLKLISFATSIIEQFKQLKRTKVIRLNNEKKI
jgi:hypothetical protein